MASSNSGSNEVKDAELRDMIRRFCVGAILTATLFILAMSHLVAVAVPVPVVVVVVVVVAVPVVVAVVVVVVVVAVVAVAVAVVALADQVPVVVVPLALTISGIAFFVRIGHDPALKLAHAVMIAVAVQVIVRSGTPSLANSMTILVGVGLS